MKWKLLLLLLLLLPVAYAQSGDMKLLAVSEDGKGNFRGSIANLNLDIKEGTGKIFIDTYPFSKIDTQISTRFAKEMACDFLDINCNNMDFFYTISAESYIIGGPSGSSAIAALTVMTLDDVSFDKNIVISGTINSGGFIGPVGGLKEKIKAAADINLTKVLIPIGTRKIEEKKEVDVININDTDSNITNSTIVEIDLIEYGKNLSIEIKEVASLNEVIYEFSGKRYQEDKIIEVDESYKDTMKYLANTLCNKSSELRNKIMDYSPIKIANIDSNLTKMEIANNLTTKGYNAIRNKSHYSGASYCFGANVKFREILVELENNSKLDALSSEIEILNSEIDKKGYKTMTDLQAYMVVKERISEAKISLTEAYKKQEENKSITIEYAYAIERLYSAESWSKFLDSKGKEFEFSKEELEDSCIRKISEAEERFQYLDYLIPNLDHLRKELNKAKADKEMKNYELCLFRAAKAKAQINSVLNYVGTLEIEELIRNKLEITEQIIAKKVDVFPIVGYSYFEYANTLIEEDPYSAMLYGEYALELSDLEIYFKQNTKEISLPIISPENILYLFSGIIIGVILMGFRKNKAQ